MFTGVKPPWPIGLHVVFGLVVLGLLVSTGQVAYYGVMGHGLFPDEIGGKWALPSYVLSYLAIMFGGFRLRRLFTLTVTVSCIYSIPATLCFNWSILPDFWRDIFGGRITLARLLTRETWCFVWNNICLGLDAGVLLYLVLHEFRVIGPGRSTVPDPARSSLSN